MVDISNRLLFLGLLIVAVLSLGACREEEQGRFISFEPGKFLGTNPDKVFSKELSASLRARTVYQSGSSTPVGGSTKHGVASIDHAALQSLRLRAWSQSGKK